MLNGNCVFRAGARLLAHKRVGVGNAYLRFDETRINFQRRVILIECVVKSAGHAQDFCVCVMRVRFIGQQRCITLHGCKCFVEHTLPRIAIRRFIQGRREFRIHFHGAFEYGDGALHLLLIFDPYARQPQQMLVARILLQHCVHRLNRRDHVPFTGFRNPVNHQLLAIADFVSGGLSAVAGGQLLSRFGCWIYCRK